MKQYNVILKFLLDFALEMWFSIFNIEWKLNFQPDRYVVTCARQAIHPTNKMVMQA